MDYFPFIVTGGATSTLSVTLSQSCNSLEKPLIQSSGTMRWEEASGFLSQHPVPQRHLHLARGTSVQNLGLTGKEGGNTVIAFQDYMIGLRVGKHQGAMTL